MVLLVSLHIRTKETSPLQAGKRVGKLGRSSLGIRLRPERNKPGYPAKTTISRHKADVSAY